MSTLEPVTLNAAIEPLIPVYKCEIEGRRELVIKASELYAFLGIQKDFSSWIKDYIKRYNFKEGRDFRWVTVSIEKDEIVGDRLPIECILLLSAAKKIAITGYIGRGVTAFHYFDDVERQIVEQQLTSAELCALEDLARRKVLMTVAPESQSQAFEELWSRVCNEFGVDKREHIKRDQFDMVAKYIKSIVLDNSDPGFRQLLANVCVIMVQNETMNALRVVEEKLRRDLVDIFTPVLYISMVSLVKNALLQFENEFLIKKH